MGKVLFKMERTVRELPLPENEVFSFDYGGPHELHVTLRPPNESERAKGHEWLNAFCTTRSIWEPSDKNWEVFERIASGDRLPWLKDLNFIPTQYVDPSGRTINLPARSDFPEHFRSFLSTVGLEMEDFAHRTINVFRWNTNNLGPHSPISTRGDRWSFDGDFWHPVPSMTAARLVVRGEVKLAKDVRELVQETVRNNGDEPIYHSLFREAWRQYDDNPRSALVMGIASAEIAFKHCIATLVPDAEWLAMNAPSPPLEKMLKDYLTQMPVRCKFDDAVKPFPDRILAAIKKGVYLRNNASHAGTAGISPDTVKEILEAVQDILWLLDYYCGNSWTIRFLSDATKSEMQIVS